MFYIAQYPVSWTALSALHFTLWLTCSFRHQLDLSGKHSSHAAITREDYSLTLPPQVLILQLNELVRRGENGNARTLKREQMDSNPGSLDCESGILPLSYRTAHKSTSSHRVVLVPVDVWTDLSGHVIYKVS